jgi:hypothetical protein
LGCSWILHKHQGEKVVFRDVASCLVRRAVASCW